MRLKGWETRLNAVVARHRTLPFGWGTSDCCILPLDGILAITGVDPWPGLHDYDSAFAAARRMAEQGYSSLADALADRFSEVPPVMAQRGDVGVVRNGDALCTGGLSGALMSAAGFVAKGEQGVVSLPRERVERAFRVE